jgi:prepilin-type N-terminal cleavage/methylation domain-containing protein
MVIAIASVAMTVLLVAGVAKLLDLSAFERDLASWRLIPNWARDIVVVCVPMLEVILFVSWLLWKEQRRRICRVTIGLLIGVTCAYVIETFMIGPPTCACFGLLSAYLDLRDGLLTILMRNMFLATLLLPTAFGPLQHSSRSVWSDMRTGVRKGGFTLLELIVVIAIISLLIVLLAPSLRLVRDRADRVKLHSRLCGHVAAFSAYTSDYKEQWPFPTVPNATYTVVTTVPQGRFRMEFWDVYAYWHVALSDSLYRRAYTDSMFRARDRDGAAATWMWYSPAFLADGDFFTPGSRTGRGQWRSTRMSEVQYPDKKALFACPLDYVAGGVSASSSTFQIAVPFAFVDGSVSDVDPATMLGWYPDGTGFWDPGGGMSFPFPGTCTLGGVRGRDRE